MTRTVAREISVQIGFGLPENAENAEQVLETFLDKDYFASLAAENELFSEYPGKKQLEYIKTVVSGVFEHRQELDGYIERYARGWKLSRISHIAVTLLRTALFEVLYMDEVPDSVAINEAVELSKGYEEQETVSFINGILGSFMRAERGYEPTPEREPESAAPAEEAPAAEQAPAEEALTDE